MKVIITGGHLTPALATIDEIKKLKGVDVVFIGRKHTMEGDKTPSAESIIIKQLKIPFYSINAGRLQRKFTRYTLPALFKTPLGLFQSLSILKKEKPDIILSFGGYIALPVVYAGWVLGIPAITHEQSLESGLANKLISKVARKVAVTWEESKKYFPRQKVVVTGLPMRKELLNIKREKVLKKLIYITGGNQGSHTINKIVKEILPELLENFSVVHQAGETSNYKDLEVLQEFAKTLPKRLQNRYKVAKWFNINELREIYSKATLVVGRSGANTIFEIASVGVPSILIPISWSQNEEQLKNAKVLQNVGASIILPEEELTPKRLNLAIKTILINLPNYRKNSKIARKIINRDAASVLVEEALKLVK